MNFTQDELDLIFEGLSLLLVTRRQQRAAAIRDDVTVEEIERLMVKVNQ